MTPAEGLGGAIRITPALVDPVAEAVSQGFHDNEVWEWVIPDRDRRLRLMYRSYRSRIRSLYVPRGEAWTTADAVGAALWIPPGQPKRRLREELLEALSMLPGIGPKGARRGIRIEKLMDQHHPTEPHWYLEVLSVHPTHQRQGYGTTLLAPVLDRCDAEGTAAYLETNRESNLPYYRRFGFELTERIALPDSPPLWLMWREPAYPPRGEPNTRRRRATEPERRGLKRLSSSQPAPQTEPMSTRTSRFLVEAPAGDLLRGYRSALDRLGWEHLEDGQGYLLSREDAVTLCCKESPAKARLQLEPIGGSSTIAELVVTVPGFGPIASRNVRDRLGLVERAVRSIEARSP